MSKIEKIEDIETIVVHWSESKIINDELGHDENYDIEKNIEPAKFDEIVKRAAMSVEGGYDKTNLSVTLKNGTQWCKQSKFYLHQNDAGLLMLLNR